MKTGQTIVDTLDFAASLSGSSQSSSSDKSASKRHKTTGIYPLNTTDFITSKKVDVDMDLLKKVESEELKAEKKMAKEAREANRCEESEVQQKAIEEANLLGRESKEKRKEESKRVKEAKKRAKKEERKRAKDAKATMRAENEKAALEITKSKGVFLRKRTSKWEVAFWFDGKKRHLGCFDDHTEAVAVASSYGSMTKEERKVRFNIQ
jgi:membrane protein involved in colicin uptake